MKRAQVDPTEEPTPHPAPSRRPAVGRRFALAVVILGAVLIVVVGIRLVQVHDQTWDWRLTSSATPTKLEFGGRDYLRDGSPPNQPLGAVQEVGRTNGGGLVLLPSLAVEWHLTPMWLIVEAAGQQVSYSLIGGP